ncbi:hypothetical protein AK812_SmicGene23680 [Symbiodinium microadriaticum]|uniref:Uncharacterized protein n=1 Tax=Symbiodinium microadriaticum TaxID=2951 RepID=A0A1Q9DGM0_SYMMI|nr:hypothetical protein AK812_SmicGene23680 [Symbiodinium microadriaticum]
MASDASGDAEARLRLSQLIAFGEKMAQCLPEQMKEALCTPVGEPNAPLVTDRPNAKKSPASIMIIRLRLENRWILNRFLDVEDWQVRSPSQYEVQVVLETFNEKLKELDDEYALNVSRIRALWSKMRKMWSNTPGKSRNNRIQEMKDKMRKATYGHQMCVQLVMYKYMCIVFFVIDDLYLRSRSPRSSQPLGSSDDEAAPVINRKWKRNTSSEEESSDSSMRVSADVVRNSMNGESIYNFMHPPADATEDAEKHFTAESFDWDGLLKENPHLAFSEAGFDEAVKNIWDDPPKPVPAGDDKPSKNPHKKKSSKSRRRLLLQQNLQSKANSGGSKKPKASPEKTEKPDIREKKASPTKPDSSAAKKASPPKTGQKPPASGDVDDELMQTFLAEYHAMIKGLLDGKYKCEVLLRQKALKPKGVDQEHGRSISLRIGVKEAWEQLNHALGRVISKKS